MTTPTTRQAQARIRELRKIIRHHRILYYNDMPQITDAEFDAYVDELQSLDPKDPVLFEVGAPVPRDSKWIKGTHQIPMGSLDKVNTEQEFAEWVGKVFIYGGVESFCVQEKLDGFSISLSYEDGRLVRALTRGAGVVGEDITRNVVKAQGVLRQLPVSFTGSLRGECVLLDDDFLAYNQLAAQNGWTVFKNRRNGASGLARRLSGEGVEHLTVLFYDLVSSEGPGEAPGEFAKLTTLESWGLQTPFFAQGSAADVVELYKSYEDVRRARLDYDIDGLVIKVNYRHDIDEVEARLKSDSHSDRNPKSQIAWKFSDETRVTTLNDLVWQTGKSGQLAPVGLVQPTPLGGVTIRRCSLHNWANIQELGITLGAKVMIKRANEVIPQVVEVLESTGQAVAYPTHCPECGGATAQHGKHIICANPTCPAVLTGTIRKWIVNLEIDHFGEKLIESLVNAGKLRTPADLYTLSEADMTSLDGVGERGAQRALRNLHNRKSVPLWLLLGSLNIRGFGRSLAKYMVEDGLDTVDKVLSASPNRICQVPKFGEERGTLVHSQLSQRKQLIRDLLNFIEIESSSDASTSSGGKLSGLSFCITGRLSRPKKEWQSEIESAGGEYKKSVRKGLDYLVCANPDGGSSKLRKAAKYGTQVITEEQLQAML